MMTEAELLAEVALQGYADALVEQVATVHERHACPKCRAPIGYRCASMTQGGYTFEGARLVRIAPLTAHPHAERRRLEVPDR